MTHLLHLYDAPPALAAHAAAFLRAGLDGGEAVLAFPTQAMAQRLSAALADARRHPRLLVMEAEAVLARMAGPGGIDPAHAMRFLQDLLDVAAPQGNGTVRVFSQLEAPLRGRGQARAAAALEQAWNRLAERNTFLLLCAYPQGAPQAAAASRAALDCMLLHQGVLATEAAASTAAAEA
ncbi:MAG TPA: MEDS domain-containing protein [Candidatus Thermoplasmatota archaeon]|nr:MEDS domain-containing protein [Candidatus Thermoplasmatota archaeon]